MSYVIIKNLGLADYESTYEAMQKFTLARDDNTIDEFWCVQHPPVFTQGRAGKPEHILNPSNIPVVETDRGGQVTFHGPGQMVIYPLCNLNNLKQGIQDFVSLIEVAMVDYLKSLNIDAYGNDEARGVYVGNKKIGSIGLRIKKQCSYHGLSLNYDMDLSPFKAINPCGYEGLEVAQVADFCALSNKALDIDTAFSELSNLLAKTLGYDGILKH